VTLCDTVIRALSAASAAKFNIAPVRWQHPSHVAIVPTESKGKTEGNDWDTKHKFLQYVTIKNGLFLFHYQNNFEMNSSSAILWRHLPVACNNFFEAGVSGNTFVTRNVFQFIGQSNDSQRHGRGTYFYFF
jgi:hypothetical protein